MTEVHSDADTTHEGSAEADETPWPREGFEDRRAIAAVRGRLFGRAEVMRIGRYRIERRLGAGGMGEVYLGVDAELERKVAIKCVRPDLDDPGQAQRLRREARALAQLSDPNVVQVYEVGEHEDQTYIAMEFVEGRTLAEWLEQPRDWRELVALFVDAGRGLAAAHSAGVVHRDFKPENVLIGADGRARVADFGLAVSGPISGALSGAKLGGATLSHLTEADRIVGTVRYMSLEQLSGAQVGPHSDQFAFCVALYEALWGQPPFVLDSVAARIEALEADAPRVPARVGPRRLWTIVRRGLAREPAQRWPSLGGLLDALAALPGRRRRLVLGGLGLGLAGLLGGWPLLRPAPAACEGLEGELAEVWDAQRSAAARHGFAEHGAESRFARVDAALDEWASAWLDERRSQCDAAQTRRDSEGTIHARRSCLDAQRRQLAVLGEALVEASPLTIERAVVIADELPDPRACAADLVAVEPELDALTRARVDALREQLAELAQLRLLAQGRSERAQSLVEEARALGHAPLLAEAVAEQARTELATGSAADGLELLARAGDLALEAGHERLVATLWLELASWQLTEYPDPALGRRHATLARVQWARLEPEASTRAQLRFVDGLIAHADGDDERAARDYRAALELLGERPHATRPRFLVHLAAVSPADEGMRLRRDALALAEQLWGPSHPETGGYVFSLGRALYEAGRRDEALPLFERAVESWTAAHGEPHPDLARAYELLVVIALAEYRDTKDEAARAAALERAQLHAERVVEVRAQTLPKIHRAHGDAAMQLSRIAALRGDRRAALGLAVDALAHYRQTLDADDPELTTLALDIADSALGLAQLARARTGYLEVASHTNEPKQLARAELGLLELAVREGQLDEARAHLDAAAGLGPDALGEQILSLAILQAIVELREGCGACTKQSRARLPTLVAEAGWSRAAISGWLDELGLEPKEQAKLTSWLE